MSKILKITMILVMTVFAVFVTPQERASANPLAVGGALYLGGAGVYVVGVTAIAGIVGLAGCESCQEDMEYHAQQTWDNTTQLAKTGIQLMVDASVGAGNSLQALNTDFINWMEASAGGLSQIEGGLAGLDIFQYNYGSSSINSTSGTIGIAVNHNMSNASINWTAGTTNRNSTFLQLNVQTHENGQYRYFTISQSGTILANWSGGSITKAQTDFIYGILKSGTSVTTAGVMAIMNYMGLKATLSSTNGSTLDTYNLFQTGVSNVREVWQDMKDAGLVLPTDSARLVNEYGPVTYDPATDSYAGIDGVNVAREDIVAQYPNVRYKTEQDLLNAGAAAGASAGLYIDGWTDATSGSTTSTYDPATDITTTTTSGTTSTNVTTGETVTTGATTTTTTGDTTGNPTGTPEGGTPKTQTGKSNRWGKLVTTKFPFSLPWDLFFILSFMNADPVSPVFEVDERIMKRENVEGIQIKFSIDLSFLDPYVPWFRRFLVLGFAFFLVMNTRKLLGGAQ